MGAVHGVLGLDAEEDVEESSFKILSINYPGSQQRKIPRYIGHIIIYVSSTLKKSLLKNMEVLFYYLSCRGPQNEYLSLQ